MVHVRLRLYFSDERYRPHSARQDFWSQKKSKPNRHQHATSPSKPPPPSSPSPALGDAAAMRGSSRPSTPSTLRHRGGNRAAEGGNGSCDGVHEAGGDFDADDPISDMVDNWSEADVGQWIGELGHEAYVANFVTNGVDGVTLKELTEEDLQHSLGVTHLGQRKSMMKSIAALRGKSGGDPSQRVLRETLRGSMQRLVNQHVAKKKSTTDPLVSKLMSVITSCISIGKMDRVAAIQLKSPTSQNYTPTEEGIDEEEETG